MKKKNYILAAVCAVILTIATACTSTSPGGAGGSPSTNSFHITPAQAKQAATLATRIGTRIAVIATKDPSLTTDFNAASVGIDQLILGGKFDSQSVREVLAQIDVKPDDQLWQIIEGLLDVWQIYLDPLLASQIDRNEYVRPILESLRDGLRTHG